MNDLDNIKYLKNSEIHYEKWDSIIKIHPSGKLYARTWYLDKIAEGWEAIVYGAYEYVMALPVKRKYGLKYVYQPIYCQQLGIFPNPPLAVQKEIAQFLKNKFRYIYYQLNCENNVTAFEGFQIKQKVNLILHLLKDYDGLFNSFSAHAKRNINTAQKNKVTVIKGELVSNYIDLKKKFTKVNSGKPQVLLLQRLMATAVTLGKGIIYTAWSVENEICAAVFTINDGNRIYYLNAFSTEEGRQNRAAYLIADEIIKEYAGTGRILDFEGSVVDGVARFYKGFGAVIEDYYLIQLNRFPIINKLMRK